MNDETKDDAILRINRIRIMEAVLISCITAILSASFSGWISLAVIKTQLLDMKESITAVRSDMIWLRDYVTRK